jgi:hypothetical protein
MYFPHEFLILIRISFPTSNRNSSNSSILYPLNTVFLIKAHERLNVTLLLKDFLIFNKMAILMHTLVNKTFTLVILRDSFAFYYETYIFDLHVSLLFDYGDFIEVIYYFVIFNSFVGRVMFPSMSTGG